MFIESEKGKVMLLGKYAQDTVHDIQVVFRKTVQGGNQFFPVLILDALIVKQVDYDVCGLFLWNFVDFCQNIYTFNQNAFHNNSLFLSGQDLLEERIGNGILIQIVFLCKSLEG